MIFICLRFFFNKLVKLNRKFIFQPIFQMNVESTLGTGLQQTNLLPIHQAFDNAPMIIEQMKILQDRNECTIIEPFLPGNDSDVLEYQQTTVDSRAKGKFMPLPTTQNTFKRSPGRPRKTGVTSQVC